MHNLLVAWGGGGLTVISTPLAHGIVETPPHIHFFPLDPGSHWGLWGAGMGYLQLSWRWFSKNQTAAPKLLSPIPPGPTIQCASEPVGLALWACDHAVGWLGSSLPGRCVMSLREPCAMCVGRIEPFYKRKARRRHSSGNRNFTHSQTTR